MKQQFQSIEALRIRLTPFVDKITGDYIIGGDTATVTVERPDGTSFLESLVWDSTVHIWWYDIPVGSYMQGEWRIEAISSNANAFHQWKTPMWGDYVENLDSTVSSRLAFVDYVVPDNTSIAAIKAQTDLLPADPASDTTVMSRLAAVDYTAPDNANVAAIKAKTDALPSNPASQTNLDVAVSSRLAAGAYVAPDNAGVSSIKAKTDALPLDPAKQSTLLNVSTNVSAAITAANAAKTSADASLLATQAINVLVTLIRKSQTNRTKVDVAAATFTVYDDDGTTPVCVFNLKDETGAANAIRIFERLPR